MISWLEIHLTKKKLEVGKYNYRIEKYMYHSSAGIIELNKDKKAEINIKLKANFGFAQISTNPEQGASIEIDGKPISNKTPYKTEAMVPGTYKVRVKKAMFQPQNTEFTIAENQTTQVNIDLVPNFGTINITTSPEASIYIDDEERGYGTYKGRLMPGLHSFEAEKDSYTSDKKQLEILQGENTNLSLHAIPKTGSIDIVSNPFGAVIILDGKEYGTTPNTIKDLLIGTHTLELIKDGYNSLKKTITIIENQTTTINEKLSMIEEIIESNKNLDFVDEVIFTIDSKKYYLSNLFRTYSKNNEKENFEIDYFDLYLNFNLKAKEALDLNYHKKDGFYQELNGYHKQLVNEASGKELESKINEYFAGILLFNISDAEIWTKGVETPNELYLFYKNNKNSYATKFSNVNEILKSENGKVVVADYQTQLEKKWLSELKMKHDIRINEGVKNKLSSYYRIYKIEQDDIPFKNEYKDVLPEFNNTPRSKISDRDLHASYERMQYNIKASHILIKCEKDALPADTLKAYNKINRIRNEIVDGADFASLAQLESNDPSAKKNRGDLGYFGAFAMVKPFEIEAYSTPVGQVSNILRTKFGYHIIKVADKIPNPGKIKVAHIMRVLPKESNPEKEAQELTYINSVYDSLLMGIRFEDLALRNSNDKRTANNGGELKPFGMGQMVPSFEEAAFKLKNIGDYSKPVKTTYGYHIIKLLQKMPVGSFEKEKLLIEEKLKKSMK